jgi:hypothetical protein
MPDPTSLTQYADQSITASNAALATGRARADAARASETSARNAVTAATLAVTEASADVAVLRKQLAAAKTPADADALAIDLGIAILAQRAAAGQLGKAQLTLAEASGESALATDAVQALTASAAETKALAGEEKAGAARRGAAIAALGAPPVSDVKAGATALLADPLFAAAKAKVEADLPAALRDRAVAQAAEADKEAARRTEIRSAARASLDAALEEGGRAADTLPRLRAKLAEAEAALQRHVGRAVADLAGARNVLTRLADGDSALSGDEHASLFDPAQQVDREAAATAEKDRDNARATARDALKTLTIERERFIAGDPTANLAAAEADPMTAVGAAKAASVQADADLVAPEAAFTAAKKTLLASWRGDAPDAAWAKLAGFVGAKATLDRLKANPTPLKTAVTGAEAAVLAALLTRDVRDRRVAIDVAAEAVRQAADDDYARSVDALRALALRGVAS